MKDLPAIFQSQFETQLRGRGMPPATLRAFSAAMRQALNPGAMDAGIRQELLSHCNKETLTAFIGELRTPLGEKMSRMETYSMSPQGRAAVRQYAATVHQQSPTAKRLAVLRSIERNLGTAEFGTDFCLAVTLTIAKAWGANGSPSDSEIQTFRVQFSPHFTSDRIDRGYCYIPRRHRRRARTIHGTLRDPAIPLVQRNQFPRFSRRVSATIRGSVRSRRATPALTPAYNRL
jgi:hypothetical protein